MEKKMTGVELIAQERQEQIEKHGYTLYEDSQNNDGGQLLQAAQMISFDYDKSHEETLIDLHCPVDWSVKHWEKMVRKPYKDRLIIAGALIAAELDRLNYD